MGHQLPHNNLNPHGNKLQQRYNLFPLQVSYSNSHYLEVSFKFKISFLNIILTPLPWITRELEGFFKNTLL